MQMQKFLETPNIHVNFPKTLNIHVKISWFAQWPRALLGVLLVKFESYHSANDKSLGRQSTT